MQVTIDLSTEQAAALASALRVRTYADEADALQKSVDAAVLLAKKRDLIGAVARSEDAAQVDATIATFNTSARGGGGVIINPIDTGGGISIKPAP